MAIRTVSNAGGIWNNTSTWVGGIRPVAGRDSVAFTATSGPLILTTATANATIKGIDFRNYTNTFTMRGVSLIIDDTNTSGRASFVNLGTGSYTVVIQDYLGGPVLPADNTDIGFYVTPQLSQVCTLTSNGTPWEHVLQINTDQVVNLADDWVQNGRWSLDYGPSGQGTTLRNNSITLNGEHTFVDTGIEAVNPVTCYSCTSTIIFNRPTFYFGYNLFDGTNFVINSTTIIGSGNYGGNLTLLNSLGGTCNLTMTAAPIVDLPNGLYVNGGTVNITANVINGYLGSFAADTVLTCNATSVTGLDYQAGISCVLNTTGDMESINANITGNLTVTAANITNAFPLGDMNLTSSGGNITINATQLSPTAGGLTVSAPLGTVTLNTPTITLYRGFTVNATTIDTSAVTSLTAPEFISITQTASNLTPYSFTRLTPLNLTTSLTLSAVNLIVSLNTLTTPTVTFSATNLTASFDSISADTCTFTSTTSSTISLGNTAGSIALSMTVTSPTCVINKGACSIGDLTVVSTTQATLNGGTDNTLNTFTVQAPLLILDAANVMQSSTIMNLRLNTVRTIQLTSAMNVDVIAVVGVTSTTLIDLSFTGSFGATIGSIFQVGTLRLTPGNSYLFTRYLGIARGSILSLTPGVQTTLNVTNTCTNVLVGVNMTDIDASLSPRGFFNFYGTITNCTNVRSFAENTLPQISTTF